MTVEEQFPLCVAAGEDANAFKETELRNKVTELCNKHVPVEKAIYQLKILRKIINNEFITPEDIGKCLLVADLPDEQWKPCTVTDKYYISSLGRVKAMRNLTIQALGTNPNGYFTARLSHKNAQKISTRVHRLVAQAFIPKTEEDIRLGRNCINHKDCNRINNRVENLEWCTIQENARYARIMNSYKNEIVNHDLAFAVRSDYLQGMYLVDIAKKYCIPKDTTYNLLFKYQYRWPDLPIITAKHHMDRSGLNSSQCKFDLNQLLEIKLRLLAGETGPKLAKMFNVHRSTIQAIRSGRYYSKMKLEDYPTEVAKIKRKLGID